MKICASHLESRLRCIHEILYKHTASSDDMQRKRTTCVTLHSVLIEWSGGAMVLGKFPVSGRPTYLDYSRARAYCACSRRGWGRFGHFSGIYHFSFLSPSLWETARYRLKYCLKGPLGPKQPTNQLIEWCSFVL